MPWGAASLAAHLVLVVLAGMSQIARSVDGTGAKADVPAESPSPPSVGMSPTEFRTDPPPIEPQRLPASPPPEIPWPREPDMERTRGPGHQEPDPPDDRRLARVRVGERASPPAAGGSGSGAILAALRWLARHQSRDGTWRVRAYTRRCHRECLPNPGQEDFDVGVTALALLAFSRAGYTPASPEIHDKIGFGAVMRDAIAALVARQDPEGCIGSRSAQKYMYNHALATLALAEATRRSFLFRPEVRAAAGFLLLSQNPGKGWRYSTLCGDNDTFVTGWAVQALRAAEPFSDGDHCGAYAGAIAWFDEVTGESYGRVGYLMKDLKCFTYLPPRAFDWHEGTTALAAATRWPIEGGRSPEWVRNSMDLLARDKPQWGQTSNDFMYWHAGTLAIKTVDGDQGKRWDAWKEATTRAIVPNQHAHPGECRDGSWEPVDCWSHQGGRVYATAINALTLLLLSR